MPGSCTPRSYLRGLPRILTPTLATAYVDSHQSSLEKIANLELETSRFAVYHY